MQHEHAPLALALALALPLAPLAVPRSSFGKTSP